jgi:hypothetical protein
VRHRPLPVDAVALEPAADLLVDAAVGHARECINGLVASKPVVMGKGAGQQELDGQGLGEHGRAAPAAVLPAISAEQALHRVGGQVALRGGDDIRSGELATQRVDGLAFGLRHGLPTIGPGLGHQEQPVTNRGQPVARGRGRVGPALE